MQTSIQLRNHKRRLKRTLTESEKLFAALLDQQEVTYKAQMILGFYILDFCIPDRMINIELDGSAHADRAIYDKRRDHFVESCGFIVIRVPNSKVTNFNFLAIKEYALKTEAEFRSGLAKANSMRSLAMRRRA